jgi:hypothetical protein
MPTILTVLVALPVLALGLWLAWLAISALRNGVAYAAGSREFRRTKRPVSTRKYQPDNLATRLAPKLGRELKAEQPNLNERKTPRLIMIVLDSVRDEEKDIIELEQWERQRMGAAFTPSRSRH